jgi:hypothetical protein
MPSLEILRETVKIFSKDWWSIFRIETGYPQNMKQ